MEAYVVQKGSLLQKPTSPSTFYIPPHLQLAVQICVRRHHMLVLLLPGDLDERLLGFPVLLLELVHHRRVLALVEAVQIVPGVAAAMTQGLHQCCDCCPLPLMIWEELIDRCKHRSILTNFLPPFFTTACGESREQLRLGFLLGNRCREEHKAMQQSLGTLLTLL